MPLILLTGYPTSGKTHRATQLLTFLNHKIANASNPRHTRLSTVLINDQSLNIPRTVYSDAKAEKDARAAETSAIKRGLGKDVIVVADGLNYIKGFRYQLYCEAKALQTPNCVIHVGTPVEKCRELNALALIETEGAVGYAEEVFENLVFRYEEPNGMARWDSPLFTVLYEDESLPLEAIWEALIGSDGNAKVVRPNLATVLAPATDSDYLYELDKTTQEVTRTILDWQKDHSGEGGGEIPMPEGVIDLPTTPVSLPQLQRLRRQYISLNRQHKLPKDRIRESFVAYLNDSFG